MREEGRTTQHCNDGRDTMKEGRGKEKKKGEGGWSKVAGD